MQCFRCNALNPTGQKYCGNCGAYLDPTIGPLKDFIESDVRQQIQAFVQDRYTDSKIVENEITDAVRDRMMGWAKYLGTTIGIIVAVLAFLGIKSFSDLYSQVDAQRNQLQSQITNEQKALQGQIAAENKQFRQITAEQQQIKRESDNALQTVADIGKRGHTLNVVYSQDERTLKDIQSGYQKAQANLNKNYAGLVTEMTSISQSLSSAVSSLNGRVNAEVSSLNERVNAVDARGPDVSQIEGTVDWSAVQRSGASFGLVKATEGVGTVDLMFRANWSGMKKAGLVRGCYAFLRPDLDNTPEAEANFFVTTLQKAGVVGGDLPPVADIETGNGDETAYLLKWLSIVQSKLGWLPIVFTYGDFARHHLNSRRLASLGYSLWIADYTNPSATAPSSIAQWTRWTFWQHTDQATYPGINGLVDENLFNGSPTELQLYLSRTAVAASLG